MTGTFWYVGLRSGEERVRWIVASIAEVSRGGEVSDGD